jgi:hypothetical protein
MVIDLKTLSEMPSVKEMMQRLKKPRRVSTTKVTVGPLNNEDAPEGMLDNANTKEAIKAYGRTVLCKNQMQS